MAESALQSDMHTLFSSHHGWLFSWLRKKRGCSRHAADVAQDAFLRIIASRDVFRMHCLDRQTHAEVAATRTTANCLKPGDPHTISLSAKVDL